jgi:hypothetical protein
MNRSILIVICDFLLVSLLIFSSPDANINNATEDKKAAQPVLATNQVDTATENGKDLAAAMRLALTEEQKNREQLMAELERAQNAAKERASQIQSVQQELESREQQARQLQEQQALLEQKFAAAQTNLQSLGRKLQSASTEASLTKEQLAAMQLAAQKKSDEAAALQKQLAELAQSNRMVLNEKQQLASRLQVAEVEKQHAAEQAARMAEEVKTERAEKAKLAEGVTALASKSSQLAQEIRENRPLAPNAIFSEFAANRVQARITASRSGIFGNEATRSKDAGTILVSDGTNTYALCHVQDTPLALWNPGTDWESLTGTLQHGSAHVDVKSLSFHFHDPRLVWIPLSAADVQALGCKVYKLSADPYKFQDAVLIGARDGYYGECRFQIDLSAPEYVRLDNSFLKGLFGKFNPSPGDLVFSKTGELLGVMMNGTYCIKLGNFDPCATIRFGNNVASQRTGDLLSALYTQVAQLPPKLQ